MDGRNLLIFTVYLIIVTYVFYKAYQSLENKVTVELESADLNEELAINNLKSLVDIDFKKMRPSYQFDELKTLMISIKNKSDIATIRINWDESSISDYEGNVRRVIRVTKGLADIPQKQVPSIIVSSQKITEELSDDRDIGSPLFKPRKLKKASQKGEPFTLRLSFKVTQPGESEQSCFVSCNLVPRKLRWTKALKIALTPLPPKKK